MSKEDGRNNQRRVLGRESGLEALRQSPEFRGPVEPSDDHRHSNDHFALIYESHEDQFASAIPFISQGLERGERCLYVADDNSTEDVLSAMQDYGIDVDSVLESGALSVLTPADTYRRTGEFDRTAMLAFWEESLEQAKDEGGYTGLRAAAEMTWALDGDTSADELVEYEAVLNPLYQDEDYVVMCQYSRDRFPTAIIHDVIKTHPHIIADNTVSQNTYYTPPEKFFDSEEVETKVDRMMQTLRERTEVKTELKERQAFLERVFESSHDAILIVDPEADEFVDANPAATEMLGYTHDELLTLSPSDVHPDELDEFREFAEEVFADGTGWIDELTCRTKEGGTIPTEISASRMEHNGRPVLLAVVRDTSERREWERAQRRLYQITSDPDRAFEEKLQAVFDLGCERFDMELGGIAIAEPASDRFEVEVMNGEHEHLVPGEPYPLSETYCSVPASTGGTCPITDPVSDGFEGRLCYDEFGVRSYLGTYLEIESDVDRTFWFVSTEPRDDGFSDIERTFHHLMGQWVKYELERRQREWKLEETIGNLEESNERLESLASMIAHELRNPVTIGQIYSQQLPAETAPQAVDYVVEAFDRIENMIDVLLVLTHGQTSAGERNLVSLADAAWDAWREVDAPDATLQFEIDGEIRGDKTYLRHLFRNLFENAVQHGGTDVTVQVGNTPNGFHVADDGCGIPSEDRDTVFETGFTTASDEGGTGLGLAFVRELADVYGWTCTVSESATGGARFEFRDVDFISKE
ncbi:MEDS domain-containing protein [Natrononativus amylolyticus]|uniref:MEDS domain-containing protein n=1 Tax=Natrononativus amylolyticus TaxID=2963434 RepID=UPI0020CE9765|nr:MEDS domain-containing protein [Natrononativus amylolyticus]